MSKRNENQSLETLAFLLVILFFLWAILLAYSILVMVISAFPAADKTTQIGKAKSIGTTFLTLALTLGLCVSLFFIAVSGPNSAVPIYQPIIATAVFAGILLWGLFGKGWLVTNRPFTRIWAWYQVKFWPDWSPNWILPQKSRELKAMSFEQLLRTL